MTTIATSHAVRAQDVISVAVGQSVVVDPPETLRRVAVADPETAEAVVMGPREVVVYGRSVGSTSLLMWGTDGSRRVVVVEVLLDADTVERQIRTVFPDESIEVRPGVDALVLSGTVSTPRVAQRALEIAGAGGTMVVDDLIVPSPRQVMLQVRIAEARPTALEELGVHVLRLDPSNLRGDTEGGVGTGQSNPPRGNFLNDPIGPDETFSDAVNLYLFDPDLQLSAFIRALRSNGLFRSLAEPNLLTIDGVEASFLAGGEFPFPVVQGGGTFQSVTIVFKEFGVRLRFTPVVTRAGMIRLKVAPEVSQLNFASGLTVSGFQVPTLLSRRVETEVELRDGQVFAIAGLIDDTWTKDEDKIPILGDVPILGALFRSREMRQNRSELLVLVTPRIVEPAPPAPPVPTGEPETWDWDRRLRGPANEPTGME